MSEEWRPFFDGKYEVSSIGNVRRAGAQTNLKPIRMKIGYFKVSPVLDGKNVQRYVHRLVAEAFLGPCPFGHEVNHLDGVKTNNVLTNLEYVTHQKNMRHARDFDLTPVGSRCNRSHITESDVEAMRALFGAGSTNKDLAERYGVARATVSQIVHRKNWRHVP
ncbi:MAG: hypothetical protein NVS1B16_03650 [Pseudarthrobacter sp.]